MGDLDLDAVSGQLVADAISAVIDSHRRAGHYPSGPLRSPAAARADALVELVSAGSTPGMRHGEPRPSVTVTMDLETLLGLPVVDLDGLARRGCVLDDGTAIPRSVAERLMCTATITAILTRLRTDGTVETLGVTDLRRHATRHQRRALRERDGRCVFPGCDIAEARCDAHHLVPFPEGPTRLDNLVLLCQFHHRSVHDGGWRLWRDPTGQLRLEDPTGKPVQLVAPGHKITPAHAGATDRPPPRPRPPHFATTWERATAEQATAERAEVAGHTDRPAPPSGPAPPGRDAA